jgi:hypothetical protein
VGRFLIVVGALTLLIGVLLLLYPNLFDWFGRLPGDFRIQTRRGVVQFPLASMLLLSIVLTVVLNLLLRW